MHHAHTFLTAPGLSLKLFNPIKVTTSRSPSSEYFIFDIVENEVDGVAAAAAADDDDDDTSSLCINSVKLLPEHDVMVLDLMMDEHIVLDRRDDIMVQ